MSLLRFLEDPSNYVARERLLYAKTVFDLKLFAARSNVQVQVTEPEFDNLGHDFLASVAFNGLYIQNKSKLLSAKTQRWSIHARFLQADFANRDICPKTQDTMALPVGGVEGAYGAVLLHEIDDFAAANNRLEIQYSFFDINLANAIRHEVVELPGVSPKEADDLLLAIAFTDLEAKIEIKQKFFWPISSPAQLLRLRMHIGGPSNYMVLGGKGRNELDLLGEMLRAELIFSTN